MYLLENRTNLRKGVYIDREYSADVEYQRKLLRPILQAAKRTNGLEKKCKLQGASLEIKGKKITTKTLHKLPKEQKGRECDRLLWGTECVVKLSSGRI